MFDNDKIKELIEKIQADEDDYQNFLKRRDAIGSAGLRTIKTALQGRFLNEQRGGTPMDRCTTFLWMAIDSLSGTKEDKQENLEFLIGLLLVWYLEE
mgnify:FL=1